MTPTPEMIVDYVDANGVRDAVICTVADDGSTCRIYVPNIEAFDGPPTSVWARTAWKDDVKRADVPTLGCWSFKVPVPP